VSTDSLQTETNSNTKGMIAEEMEVPAKYDELYTATAQPWIFDSIGDTSQKFSTILRLGAGDLI